MTASPNVRIGKYQSTDRPTTRRRFATAAFVTSAVIAGVLGWRWVLIEATTEYGPGPESITAPPAARPLIKQAPPPIGVEVTVLDVHTASTSSPAAAPAKTAPAARGHRVAPIVKRSR